MASGSAASESPPRDLDRELSELLQGLRIMLPGVQVLLAFLLTVPFTNRYTTLSSGERALYFAAVMTTAVSVVILVTPVIQHRMRFREHDKEALLELSNRLLIAATIFVGASLGLVILLITEYLYGLVAAVVVTIALLLLASVLWYVSPVSRRHDGTGHDHEP
ncbi:MAG TPA: DUF6328 family protein [Acidimicrobiia bacterium]|jgi:hypothetical protein